MVVLGGFDQSEGIFLYLHFARSPSSLPLEARLPHLKCLYLQAHKYTKLLKKERKKENSGKREVKKTEVLGGSPDWVRPPSEILCHSLYLFHSAANKKTGKYRSEFFSFPVHFSSSKLSWI